MDLGIEEDIEKASALLAQKEADLRRRENEIRAERIALDSAKRKLESLTSSLGELLQSLVNPAATYTPEDGSDDDVSSTPNGGVAYGEIRKSVREAIDRIGPGRDFSSRDIIGYLEMYQTHINVEKNRSNISSYLRDFVSEKYIEIKMEGSGQRPTIYRKK